MLITNEQVDELVSVLADMSGLDEQLVEQCGDLVRAQRYDEAVSLAFVVLEERLRKLMSLRGGSGRDLVSKLFSDKDMQLIDRLHLPEEEWKGVRGIFDGAFAAYSNRAAHTVAGYTRDEARAIVHLVNLLLLIVGQLQQAPKQHVPDAMAQLLGPAVTHRLNLFLDSLPKIGIVRAKGTQYIPYKARLLYHAESWDKPGGYRFAVFYLCMAEVPILSFNIGALKRVPGLDTEALAGLLLQAGCTRSPSKDFPIQLLLPERNDQGTFDRLYDILWDLVEKHGV
jgi:hypothetical protein